MCINFALKWCDSPFLLYFSKDYDQKLVSRPQLDLLSHFIAPLFTRFDHFFPFLPIMPLPLRVCFALLTLFLSFVSFCQVCLSRASHPAYVMQAFALA